MTWTYKDSGVDIEAGDRWVDQIGAIIKKHPRPEGVVSGIGGFNGAFKVGDTVLAACCDGVGTKVLLARETGLWGGIGQDLLAMNVNDLVTTGAKPLFFLDYIACGKLNAQALAPVIEGLAAGCAEIGCALLGGETAEMPGVYRPDDVDFAGFAVGLAQQVTPLPPERGDLLVALPSSGAHSNGYSLVRSLLKEEIEGKKLFDIQLEGKTLAERVMEPTRLYVKQALAAWKEGLVKACAHITGGGLEGNVSRVTEGLTPKFDWDSWQRPALFEYLAPRVDEEEARRVFNLGLGFVALCSPTQADELLHLWRAMGESPLVVGRL